MIQGLRTAIYPTPDLARGKEWYRTVLGRDPYFDEPFYVGFSVGGFELGLIPDGEPSGAPECRYFGAFPMPPLNWLGSPPWEPRSTSPSRTWAAASKRLRSWIRSATSSASSRTRTSSSRRYASAVSSSELSYFKECGRWLRGLPKPRRSATGLG